MNAEVAALGLGIVGAFLFINCQKRKLPLLEPEKDETFFAAVDDIDGASFLADSLQAEIKERAPKPSIPFPKLQTFSRVHKRAAPPAHVNRSSADGMVPPYSGIEHQSSQINIKEEMMWKSWSKHIEGDKTVHQVRWRAYERLTFRLPVMPQGWMVTSFALGAASVNGEDPLSVMIKLDEASTHKIHFDAHGQRHEFLGPSDEDFLAVGLFGSPFKSGLVKKGRVIELWPTHDILRFEQNGKVLLALVGVREGAGDEVTDSFTGLFHGDRFHLKNSDGLCYHPNGNQFTSCDDERTEVQLLGNGEIEDITNNCIAVENGMVKPQRFCNATNSRWLFNVDPATNHVRNLYSGKCLTSMKGGIGLGSCESSDIRAVGSAHRPQTINPHTVEPFYN